MRLLLWLVVCSCLCLPAQAAEKVRTWTDVQGKTMRAEFVREVDGDATFLKDGKLITIPLDRLIEADRQVIRDLETNKEVEEPATPAGAPAGKDRGFSAPELPDGSDFGGRLAPEGKGKEPSLANRVWTDKQGNKMTARFVRVRGNFVVLMRGLRAVTLSIDSLSDEDQNYIRSVLTARGEPAYLPSSGTLADEPPADAPQGFTPGFTPNEEPPDAGAGPKLGPGQSTVFDKLRERDEERRQDQAQHEGDTGPAQPQAESPPADESSGGPHPAVIANGSAEGTSDEGSSGLGGLRTSRPPLDRQTVRELKGAAIIVVVAVGVLLCVGTIVFIAVTIASVSANRRRREYS